MSGPHTNGQQGDHQTQRHAKPPVFIQHRAVVLALQYIHSRTLIHRYKRIYPNTNLQYRRGFTETRGEAAGHQVPRHRHVNTTTTAAICACSAGCCSCYAGSNGGSCVAHAVTAATAAVAAAACCRCCCQQAEFVVFWLQLPQPACGVSVQDLTPGQGRQQASVCMRAARGETSRGEITTQAEEKVNTVNGWGAHAEVDCCTNHLSCYCNPKLHTNQHIHNTSTQIKHTTTILTSCVWLQSSAAAACHQSATGSSTHPLAPCEGDSLLLM